MFASMLTVTSVAALPVGGRIDNGEADWPVHIRRTTAEHWDLWTAAHRVTVHRTARRWAIAEQCAGKESSAIGVKPALFDAVALALATL